MDRSIDLKTCFVERPNYWIVLYKSRRPIVLAYPPTAGMRVIGTAYTQGAAERICRLWENRREEREAQVTTALFAVAGGLVALLVMLVGVLR